MNRCVFLDRDGVLIEDVGPLTDHDRIRLLPGVAEALRTLRENDFRLVVVTNQSVVARGLATESDVRQVHATIARRLECQGAEIDDWFFCPHHPHATLEEFRCVCQCRKPAGGMLLQAAERHRLDLPASFMIGDRMTDVAAGIAAGCRTVWVQTGEHLAPPIQTNEPIDATLQADHVCGNLADAARWIGDVSTHYRRIA